MNTRSPETANSNPLPALLAEFCAVADQLGMPLDERIGIAGLTDSDWAGCSEGLFDLAPPAHARCVRRLHYSLSLLHRFMSNHKDSLAPCALPPGSSRQANDLLSDARG